MFYDYARLIDSDFIIIWYDVENISQMIICSILASISFCLSRHRDTQDVFIIISLDERRIDVYLQ